MVNIMTTHTIKMIWQSFQIQYILLIGISLFAVDMDMPVLRADISSIKYKNHDIDASIHRWYPVI